MKDKDNYDYFGLNNFDDGYQRNAYRRNQSSNGRAVYSNHRNYNVNRRKKQNKKIRNRIVIILSAIIILVVIIAVLSFLFKGCTNSQSVSATISTETVSSTKATTANKTTTDTADKSDTGNKLSADYFETPTIKDDNSNGQLNYGIYVWQKTAFELFGGYEASAKSYSDTINSLADKFSQDVKVYDMVVPNHTEMGLPQRLKDGDAPSTSQSENIKTMYSGLSKRVTPINCYNYIADHNSEYVYFKSDHHWTGLGAYYAYKAFAETTKQNVLSLDDCTEKTIDGFTGSFNNSVSGIDSDTVHYWEFPYDVSMDITYADGTVGNYDSPYYQYAEAGSNTYGVFIMGDQMLNVLKSSSDNATKGKKIAVVKESYGNAFVPYLTNDYEEVHVIDFRSFNKNLVTYCSENGIDEVLFLNGVMSANTQGQLDSMSGLFN